MRFNDEEMVRCHGVCQVRYGWGAPLKDTSANQTLIEVCCDDAAGRDSNKPLVDVAGHVGSAEGLSRKVIVGGLCQFISEDLKEFIIGCFVKLLLTVRRGTC